MSAMKGELKKLKTLSPDASRIVNDVLKTCREREREREQEAEQHKRICKEQLRAAKSERSKSESLIRQEAIVPYQKEIHSLKNELEDVKEARRQVENTMKKVIMPENNNEVDDLMLQVFRKDKLEKEGIKPGHNQLVFKCLECSLHYLLMTWYPDEHPNPCCPECGQRNSIPLDNRHVEEEIYQLAGNRLVVGGETQSMKKGTAIELLLDGKLSPMPIGDMDKLLNHIDELGE